MSIILEMAVNGWGYWPLDHPIRRHVPGPSDSRFGVNEINNTKLTV
jgi:hypothetical protein